MSQCQAKCKATGEQCQRRAVSERKVCTVHGGKTPRGATLPQFRTGRYSKVLPPELALSHERALEDPRLLELRQEIALIDSRTEELLTRYYASSPSDSDRIWGLVGRELDRRERLVESERKRLNDLNQYISVQQVLSLAEATLEIMRCAVLNNVKDEVMALQILGDASSGISRLLNQPEEQNV